MLSRLPAFVGGGAVINEYPPINYFAGLDLGPPAMYTALAIAERTKHPDPNRPGSTLNHYAVRYLKRYPPGTSFTDIADEMKTLFASPPLRDVALTVDMTGVGAPVVKMISRCGLNARVRGVALTAGQTTGSNGDDLIPKLELVGTVQVLLQSRRLQLARELPDAATLVKELAAFQIKPKLVDMSGSFDAWRDGPQDDLVFAVALACWRGEREVRVDIIC